MFPAKDRDIFPYFDGIKDKFGDPLAIDERYVRAMAAHDEQAIDEALDGDEPIAAHAASAKIERAIRDAFRLPDFDEDTGSGLTRDEVITLFNRFAEWREEKKTNGVEPASSSPPTDSPPGCETPLTSNTAGCTGTGSVPEPSPALP